MSVRALPRRLMALSLAACLGLTACGPTMPRLAPVAANPNTPPMRAFTSFSGALRCMDGLLAQAKKRPLLISSTDLPDRTAGVRVGADDMLINAINQLNRTSRAYVFVDQPLERDGGQIDLLTTNGEDEIRPQIYIRGSISQLDSNPISGSVNPRSSDLSQSSGLTTNSTWSRGTSVVSVDMHLVAWPSRRILPGASVANSMVVTTRGLTTNRVGLIEMTSINTTLTLSRVESRSQAVRALIELGVIELLGRHSGVPYWTCLARDDTDAWREDVQETEETLRPRSIRLSDVQQALIDLGYMEGRPTGRVDRATRTAIARFQTEEGLIASGRVDYDLWRRLKERIQTGTRAPHVEVPTGPLPGQSGPRTPARPPITKIIQRPRSEPRGRAAPQRAEVTPTPTPAPTPVPTPASTPTPVATPVPAPTSDGLVPLRINPAPASPTTPPAPTPAPATPAQEDPNAPIRLVILPQEAPPTRTAEAPNCAEPTPGDLAQAPGCPLAINLADHLKN